MYLAHIGYMCNYADLEIDEETINRALFCFPWNYAVILHCYG